MSPAIFCADLLGHNKLGSWPMMPFQVLRFS